jgi:two-component system, OmpR family, copper resistance phosphate regulon response regulator CusR
MSFRVLLIEDDVEIASFVSQGLKEEGFSVTCVQDGLRARNELARSTWDVVLLDWWLPELDGVTLLREFRETGHTTPVLFLTARDAVGDRIQGLSTGADDYLCKPFAFDELVARIHALLRRSPTMSSTRWTYADVVFDLTTARVERGGRVLQLTSREQALLHFFMRFPDQVLSRTRIYEHVWQERFDGISNTLEVHVMELRRKLEAFGPRLIQTVRGRGYIFSKAPTKDES